MSQKSKNNGDKFSAAAHQIILNAIENNDYSIDCLHLFMLYDWMQDIELINKGFPTNIINTFHTWSVRAAKETLHIHFYKTRITFYFSKQRNKVGNENRC